MADKALALEESINSLKAHWKLDVYKGDIQTPETFQESFDGYNLITTVGKEVVMDRLFGLSAIGAMTRIGVGTSGTAAAVGNTSLTNSYFKVYDSTPTRSGTVVTCVTTFETGDANLNWQELGMDNGTTLLNRIAPIGPFSKTDAVSLVVTVTITQD
jgi:hypothetical protein